MPEQPQPARRLIQHWKLALIALVVFDFGLRLYRLEVPPERIYDEKYHAVVAAEMAKGNPDVYNPWKKRPDDPYPYEWVQPPLGKLIMAAGIWLGGDEPVPARLSSVLFGAGLIFLAALLAYELFGSPGTALLTALFLSVDGLLFVQSRVVMMDVHAVFFILLACLFYARWTARPERRISFWGVGVALGLGIATKWSALYLYPALLLDLLVRRRTGQLAAPNPLLLLSAWFLLPGLLYLASYAQALLSGYSLRYVLELQEMMWRYHTTVIDPHRYGSTPLQWLLDLRPEWFFVDRSSPSGTTANIYNTGNPVLYWGGLLAVVFSLFSLRSRFNPPLFFLVVSYLALWMPWLFSPRLIYSRHYAPALALLGIALAHKLQQLAARRSKAAVFITGGAVALACLWFIVFYPNMTAMPVPESFANAVYFAIPTWK